MRDCEQRIDVPRQVIYLSTGSLLCKRFFDKINFQTVSKRNDPCAAVFFYPRYTLFNQPDSAHDPVIIAVKSNACGNARCASMHGCT
jgi:hypothetical protein